MERGALEARDVVVGGRRVRYIDSGRGTPTVVLESGLGASAVSWARVVPALTSFTRVFAYDRAGYGGSEPGTLPRTADRLADELRVALESAGVPPPYVLAGHSWGGVIARRFARAHPDEVAGLVLIDATHEDLRTFDNPIVRTVASLQYRGLHGLARLGLVDGVVRRGPIAQVLESFPEEARTEVAAQIRRPETHTTSLDEFRAIVGSLTDLRADPALTDVPTAIVVGTQHGRLDRRLRARIIEVYERLARETGARLFRAERSGHLVPQDDPELVIDVIRTVVDEARRVRAGNHTSSGMP